MSNAICFGFINIHYEYLTRVIHEWVSLDVLIVISRSTTTHRTVQIETVSKYLIATGSSVEQSSVFILRRPSSICFFILC